MIIGTRGGLGDTLFLTPTLPLIKEQLGCSIKVNTKYPDLLVDNPYIDEVGVNDKEGLYWPYPDPIHCREPRRHHIISVWEGAKRDLGLNDTPPLLKPEIYIDLPAHKSGVGVQVLHKGQWHGKKVWPFFAELSRAYEPIPKTRTVRELVEKIASYELVVCAEGGISHIAKAVGTRAVVIFGGWCSPEWNGYPDQINVTNKIGCSYCYNSFPCKSDYKCMRQICPETVTNLISAAVQCCETIV